MGKSMAKKRVASFLGFSWVALGALSMEQDKEKTENTQDKFSFIGRGFNPQVDKVKNEKFQVRSRGYDPFEEIRKEEKELGPLKFDKERGEYHYGPKLSETSNSKVTKKRKTNEQGELPFINKANEAEKSFDVEIRLEKEKNDDKIGNLEKHNHNKEIMINHTPKEASTVSKKRKNGGKKIPTEIREAMKNSKLDPQRNLYYSTVVPKSDQPQVTMKTGPYQKKDGGYFYKLNLDSDK